MNKKYLVYSTIITLVLAGIYYYLALPPINWHSQYFYFSLFLAIGCFILCNIVLSGHPFREIKKSAWTIGIVVVVCAIFVGSVAIFSPFIRADLYASRITIREDGDFTS